MLAPPFRGRGLGMETLAVEAVLCSRLGYTANANDTLASNARMFGALRRATGRLPRRGRPARYAEGG